MSSIRLPTSTQNQTFVYDSSDSDSDSDSEISYTPIAPRSGKELWKLARILIRKASPNYFTYGVSEKRGVIPMLAEYQIEKKEERYPSEIANTLLNVIIVAGKLYNSDYYAFCSTQSLIPPTIQSGLFLFVLTQDGDLRIRNYAQKIFHSFLDQGQAIKSAGIIEVNDHGRICEISNESGHYQPKKRQLINMIAYLRIHGYQMGDCQVIDAFSDDPNDYAWYPKKSLEIYQDERKAK